MATEQQFFGQKPPKSRIRRGRTALRTVGAERCCDVPAEGVGASDGAVVADHAAVDGLALGQARRDQRLELDDVRRGELERVERRLQDLDGAAGARVHGGYGPHDGRVGGTPVAVDQQYLASVHAVQRDQLAHEYLVWRPVVQYVEPEAERVAHLRCVHVAARPVRDAHHHRGRYDERRLLHAVAAGADAVHALVRRVRVVQPVVAGPHGRRHRQLDALAHAPVLQVVRAPHRQSDVLSRHDLVVVLENQCAVTSQAQYFLLGGGG